MVVAGQIGARTGGRPVGPNMSSVNPGISAAGEAAGRTALDPSAGRAAIGGMLSVGEIPEEENPDRSTVQGRLSAAVSDITKLAGALQGLKLKTTAQIAPGRAPSGPGGGAKGADSADTAA